MISLEVKDCCIARTWSSLIKRCASLGGFISVPGGKLDSISRRQARDWAGE